MAKTLVSKAVADALAGIVHEQGGTYFENPLIQVGSASSSPVTFDHAFKTATVPFVVGISSAQMEIISILPADVDNEHFHYVNKYADTSGGTGTVQWIAIGENAIDSAGSASDGITTFLGLTDTPSTYSGQGGKAVRVNSGATALEFAARAPLGYNFGVYVTYKDADEIYVQPGNIDVNGTDVSVTTATAHTMTSMVDATADFHYIYLAAAGTITDATTEPAWSDAKFGWYSGDTRCIGAVWVPSATPAILSEFVNNVNHEFLYKTHINELLTNGNPDGTFQDLTTASTYSPVNATADMVYAWNTSTGQMALFISNYESKSYWVGIGQNGYLLIGILGWVPLQNSRDLAWYGENDDNNQAIIRIVGYKIRV
jgi:hypothetical protein